MGEDTAMDCAADIAVGHKQFLSLECTGVALDEVACPDGRIDLSDFINPDSSDYSFDLYYSFVGYYSDGVTPECEEILL